MTAAPDSSPSPAPARSRWPVVLLASAALVTAAVLGAGLVGQHDAATSSGAVRRLSWTLSRRGLPYDPTANVVEFSLNVALFVPGAFAAALLWPRVRWWQWVLVALVVSAGIETVQGAFLPGREAQVRDLCSNTLGGALGAGAAVLLRRAVPALRPGPADRSATVVRPDPADEVARRGG